VLSGYLITALLLAEHRATGEIDLRAFWVRRARRLLPALLAVLAATAVFAAVVAEPAARHGIRLDALAALAYVANSARRSNRCKTNARARRGVGGGRV